MHLRMAPVLLCEVRVGKFCGPADLYLFAQLYFKGPESEGFRGTLMLFPMFFFLKKKPRAWALMRQRAGVRVGPHAGVLAMRQAPSMFWAI